MTIREAIRQQRKSIKNRSAKEKLSFFWEYYGLKTIALLAGACLLVAFIVSVATQKEYAFSGVFFGAAAGDSQQTYLQAFCRASEIDPENYEVSVQCRPDIRMDGQMTPEVYQSMEGFSAMIAGKTVDCFAGNRELFLYYAYMEYALDLRTVLTPGELEALAPYLHYVDWALIARQEADNDSYTSAYAQHPDSEKPELMINPVPVAISTAAFSREFHEAYPMAEDALLGICAGSENMETATAFLRFCLNSSQEN